MPVTLEEVAGAFQGGLLLNLKCMREMLNVTHLEFIPKPGTPLAHAPAGSAQSTPVRVACDNTMAYWTLLRHAWQAEELDFARQVLRPLNSVCVVDVGANQGLFARQLVANIPSVSTLFAYEPHPTNFDILRFNLSPFGHCRLVNGALAGSDGNLEFFVDPDNCGNYSLNKAAMPATYGSIRVPTIAAAAESAKWMEGGKPIFYKSDTQGFDELIATNVDPRVWPMVHAGIMEIWRIDKPEVDWKRFAEILDQFGNKVFLSKPATRLSTGAVMDYLRGRDQLYEDMAFWR